MIYAVGDIHGQTVRLEAALERIERDGTGAPVVFLGDLVDRGPDARGVIERLIQGQAEGRPWIVIKGNHDRMFERFVRAGQAADDAIRSNRLWLDDRLGGPATLRSYGVTGPWEDALGRPLGDLRVPEVDGPAREAMERLSEAAREAVPEAHLEWLEGLPLVHERAPDGRAAFPLLFVHAGIRPGVPLADQSEEDLIWIRDPFLMEVAPHPWLVVHGHTPVDAATHYGNRVNLDTGAGYAGPVTAAAFDEGEVLVLGPRGRERLMPRR